MPKRLWITYIHRLYLWPKIGCKVDKFCWTCPICEATKPSNQLPQGLLHSLPIPRQLWGSIAMDFVRPFPPSEGHNYLWVILCHLTSMVHLVPIKMTIKASELACKFIQEVVRLHGLLETIVSNQDAKFTSMFWHELHWMLGAKAPYVNCVWCADRWCLWKDHQNCSANTMGNGAAWSERLDSKATNDRIHTQFEHK